MTAPHISARKTALLALSVLLVMLAAAVVFESGQAPLAYAVQVFGPSTALAAVPARLHRARVRPGTVAFRPGTRRRVSGRHSRLLRSGRLQTVRERHGRRDGRRLFVRVLL